MQKGGCLCGGVRFGVRPPLRDVVLCHCRQCRRWTGYLVGATAAWRDGLDLTRGAELLTWYESSHRARRGFCRRCGSSLFWQRLGSDQISILAGALDQPTGLAVTEQIHLGARADFMPDLPDLPGREGGGTSCRLP